MASRSGSLSYLVKVGLFCLEESSGEEYDRGLSNLSGMKKTNRKKKIFLIKQGLESIWSNNQVSSLKKKTFFSNYIIKMNVWHTKCLNSSKTEV